MKDLESWNHIVMPIPNFQNFFLRLSSKPSFKDIIEYLSLMDFLRETLNHHVNLDEIGFECSQRRCPILFKEKRLILLRVMNTMGKKAVIVVSLVEESAEKSNEEIEKEIMEELLREPARIPWMKEVEEVTVTEI